MQYRQDSRWIISQIHLKYRALEQSRTIQILSIFFQMPVTESFHQLMSSHSHVVESEDRGGYLLSCTMSIPTCQASLALPHTPRPPH
jgi:hypothetical protein